MYLEDVPIGEILHVGSYTFTEEAIIRFAEKYDPQHFHLDAEAAKSHEFGGLVASGLHIGCIWMKLIIGSRDKMMREYAERGEDPPSHSGGASPGFLNMRWIKPVRPGDTISYSNRIVGIKDLGRRKDLGILHTKIVGQNQNGEKVFSFDGQALYPRRPAQVA